jgi:A/G-specific adenine glycosylase
MQLRADVLHDAVLGWYDGHARDLPWRRPDRSPWGVLVSEIMLQQTPVVRVLPAWHRWMERWPAPADLAADAPGEAIRMWERLGYPRRALRLQACAVAIVERHGGEVPSAHADLLALPGIGSYTAAAVASFAFGGRHAVLDTNVRRVLARVVTGTRYPPASVTVAETALAEGLLPGAADAPRWAVATMELGAVVCTARTPRCDACPVAALCRWRLDGFPEHDGPPRRGQTYDGTDRKVRGLLLAVLRAADGPVPLQRLVDAAPDEVLRDPLQRDRALDGLVADGLVEPLDAGLFRLPAGAPVRFRY